MNRDDNGRSETFAGLNGDLSLNIARTTLGYLAMDDELKKRMELAFGEVRILGVTSNTTKISEKNKRHVEEFGLAFKALKDSPSESRELEILAEKLVDVCVDIISDSSAGRRTSHSERRQSSPVEARIHSERRLVTGFDNAALMD